MHKLDMETLDTTDRNMSKIGVLSFSLRFMRYGDVWMIGMDLVGRFAGVLLPLFLSFSSLYLGYGRMETAATENSTQTNSSHTIYI